VPTRSRKRSSRRSASRSPLGHHAGLLSGGHSADCHCGEPHWRPAGEGRPLAACRSLHGAWAGAAASGPPAGNGCFGADIGKTLLYGLIVALPTTTIAGPLFSAFIFKRSPGHASETMAADFTRHECNHVRPGFSVTLFTILLPGALMLLKAIVDVAASSKCWWQAASGILSAVGGAGASIADPARLASSGFDSCGHRLRDRHDHHWLRHRLSGNRLHAQRQSRAARASD